MADAVLGSALGLFVSAFARTEFQAVQFLPLIVFPQILLCGLFVPREALPAVLEAVSDVLPLSYAVDAMTNLTRGTSTSDVWRTCWSWWRSRSARSGSARRPCGGVRRSLGVSPHPDAAARRHTRTLAFVGGRSKYGEVCLRAAALPLHASDDAQLDTRIGRHALGT